MSARDLMEIEAPIVVSMPIFRAGEWANYDGRSYRIKHTVISKRELFVHLEGIQEPVPSHKLQVAWTQMAVRAKRPRAKDPV